MLFYRQRITFVLILFVIFLSVVVLVGTNFDFVRTIPIVLSGAGLALSFYFAIIKEERIGCTSECILGEILAEFFFYAVLYHHAKKFDEQQLAESFWENANYYAEQLKIMTANYQKLHGNIEIRDPDNTLEDYLSKFDTDEEIPVRIMYLYINTLSILGEKAKQIFIVSFTFNLMSLCLEFPDITKEISETVISILSFVGDSPKYELANEKDCKRIFSKFKNYIEKGTWNWSSEKFREEVKADMRRFYLLALGYRPRENV